MAQARGSEFLLQENKQTCAPVFIMTEHWRQASLLASLFLPLKRAFHASLIGLLGDYKRKAGLTQ